ncbi:MAG: recombinase family protein [Bryobacteraceae bacterium]
MSRTRCSKCFTPTTSQRSPSQPRRPFPPPISLRRGKFRDENRTPVKTGLARSRLSSHYGRDEIRLRPHLDRRPDDRPVQLAALKHARCSPIFEDITVAAIQRSALLRCLKTLRAGDTLIVWKLDRPGRSLRTHLPYGEPCVPRSGDTARKSARATPFQRLSPQARLSAAMQPTPFTGCGKRLFQPLMTGETVCHTT